MLWFVIKVFILLFCYIWLRGTLPRVRYDQLMAIGWKVLIPVSIFWILLIASVREWRLDTHHWVVPLVVFGFSLVVLFALLGMWDSDARQRADRYEAGAEPEPVPGSVYSQTRGPAFPVPPLDLPHYHGAGVGAEAVLSTTDTSPKEVTGA